MILWKFPVLAISGIPYLPQLAKENNIIPVEVKSDENVRGKSLTFYNKQYAPALRLRYSLKNLKIDDGLLNIPLFLADKTAEFIEKVR